MLKRIKGYSICLIIILIICVGCGKKQTRVLEYNIDDFVVIYEAILAMADDATEYAIDDEEATEKYMTAIKQGIAEAGFVGGDVLVISGKLHSVEKIEDLYQINVYDGHRTADENDVLCFDSYTNDARCVLVPRNTIVKVQVEISEDGQFVNDKLLHPDLESYIYENNVSDFEEISLLEQIVQGEVVEIIELKDDDELWDMYLSEENDDTQAYIMSAINSTYRIVLGDENGNKVNCFVDTEGGQEISIGDLMGVRGYVKHNENENVIDVGANYYLFEK